MSDDLNDILNAEPPPPVDQGPRRRAAPVPGGASGPDAPAPFTTEGYMARSGEYEFGIIEGSRFADLAKLMRFVGTITIVFGVLGALGGAVQAMQMDEFAWDPLLSIIQGVLFILIGMWTRGAAQNFDRVATTEGNDVTHLMGAITYLHKIYNLQAWLIGFALVLAGMVLILLIL